MFTSHGVSLNCKPVTLREWNYHDKAHVWKHLNYGFDASGTHLHSGLWFLDSPTDDGKLKDNTGYAGRLNYINNNKTIKLNGRLHADLFKSDKW